MATNYDLSIDQGSDYQIDFLVKNWNGTLKDLTGYTARMQFRTSYYSPNVILEASTSNGKLAITGSVCSILLSQTDTAALSPMFNYVYDIELTDATNKVVRAVQGTAIINPEVTR